VRDVPSADKLDRPTRVKMMLMQWWAWHHRNNAIFGKGDHALGSFIKNYLPSLQLIRNGVNKLTEKGNNQLSSVQIRLNRKC
jgi:hypothetical protein